MYEKMTGKSPDGYKIAMDEERAAYEKAAKETAKKLNSTMENLTGNGMTKEAVMATDAQIEDELRKIGGTDFLKRLNDSNLLLVFKEQSTRKNQPPLDHTYTELYDVSLEGEIDGHHIQLLAKDVLNMGGIAQNESEHRANLIRSASNSSQKREGKIDGKMISDNLSWAIWRNYYHTIAMRTEALRETKKEIK